MGDTVGTDKSFNYDLEVLTLVNNEGAGFDIRGIFLECNIYENIKNNFLTGKLAIADATGFLENAKINNMYIYI